MLDEFVHLTVSSLAAAASHLLVRLGMNSPDTDTDKTTGGFLVGLSKVWQVKRGWWEQMRSDVGGIQLSGER